MNKKIVILVILLSVLFIIFNNGYSQDQFMINKFNYLRNMQYTITKCEPNLVQLEIKNLNKDMFLTETINPEDFILFAAPDEEPPQISYISYEFSLFNKGIFVKNISSNDDDKTIKIPTASEYFKYNFEGFFRSIRIISLRYDCKKLAPGSV